MVARQSRTQPEQNEQDLVGPPAPGNPAGETRQADAEEGLAAAQAPAEAEAGTHGNPSSNATDLNPSKPIELAVSENEPAGTATPDTPFWSLPELTGTDTLPGILMAAGVLIVMFILMGRLRKGHRASAPNPASAREQIAEIRARAGDRTSIDAFKVDAQDFTRQMAAILDTKAERLERLIVDADDRLARLERAEGTEPDRRPATPSPTPPSTAPTRPRVEVTGSAEQSLDPVHERIYRMADDGLDAVQIAQKTGQPTGQVELILALRS